MGRRLAQTGGAGTRRPGKVTAGAQGAFAANRRRHWRQLEAPIASDGAPLDADRRDLQPGSTERSHPQGRRFAPGPDPRRARGNLSEAERAWKKLLDEELIPAAALLARQTFLQGMAGDVRAQELFFKICGRIKKPMNDEEIEAFASKMLDGVLDEARRRAAER